MPRFIEGLNFSADFHQASTVVPVAVASPEKEQTVELEMDAGVKDALTSIYRGGLHHPWINALAEITDNIAAAAKTDQGETTQIIVTLPVPNPEKASYGRLTIEGLNEEGMDYEDMRSSFRMGKSKTKKGVNQFGVGFKTAAMAAGYRLRMEAEKAGSRQRNIFDDPTFGDPEVPYEGPRGLKTHELPVESRGKVVTIISGLKHRYENIPGPKAVVDALSELYRPRLAAEPAKFTHEPKSLAVSPRQTFDQQGQPIEVYDKIVAWVVHDGKIRRVLPLDLQLADGYSEELKPILTEAGEVIPMWAGVKKPEAKGIAEGIRYYLSGRLLVRGDFAGLEHQHPALKDFIAEVHLDSVGNEVKQKSVSAGKSSQLVDLNAEPLARVRRAVAKEIAPLFDDLKNRPAVSGTPLPPDTLATLQRVKSYANLILGEMTGDSSPIGEALEKDSQGGTQLGQKPSRGGHPREKSTGGKLGIEGKDWEDQEERTFATTEANPDIHRKRKGYAEDILFQNLGVNDPRLTDLQVEEKDKRTRKYVVINLDHPELGHHLEAKRVSPEIGNPLLQQFLLDLVIREAAFDIGEDVKAVRRAEEQGRLKAAKMIHQDPAMRHMISLPDAPAGKGKKNKNK